MKVGDLVKWRQNNWTSSKPMYGIVIGVIHPGWMEVRWLCENRSPIPMKEPIMYLELLNGDW